MKSYVFILVSVCYLQLMKCGKPVQPLLSETKSEVQNTAAASTVTGPKEHFEKYCTSCHGNEVNAFVDRKWKYGNTKEDLVRSIKLGIPDAGMPAYEVTFSDTEVEALAEYILNGIQDRKSYDAAKIPTPKYYSTKLLELRVDTVVNEVGIPWGIKVTADGTVYFTQKEGKLKYVSPSGKVTEIQNVPKVVENVQGGLMDIALHPDFDSNNILYLSYTKRMDGMKTTTAVIQAKLVDDALVDIKQIFQAVPAVAKNYHYGSRIVFDKSGYLYVTVGDRAHRDEHPQFLNNSCGKVHRLHDDGRIPADNPFVGVADAVESIWSYGHRNPQGMIYDKQNDQIWTNEHGPRGGDELNLISKSKNYGWPVISYGINYNGTTFTTITEKENMLQPKNYWTPSIAPSGMAIVEGNNYKGWEGDILSGSLRFKYISRIEVKDDKVIHEERVLENIGRVRAIEMGADGYLYVGVESPGRILKVSPVAKN